MTETDALKEALELVQIGAPYRSYPGSGGVWAAANDQFPDADFKDWGLARAVAVILNNAALIKSAVELAEQGL